MFDPIKSPPVRGTLIQGPSEPNKERDNPALEGVSDVLSNVETVKDKKLSSRTVVVKEGEKQEKIPTPSNTTAKGFGWIYQRTTDGLAHVLLKAGEKILFNTGELRKSRLASQEQLEELTQSTEFNLFLGAISPIIIKSIVGNVLDEDDERLRGFLSTEESFLIDITDAMLPKILVNIIHHMDTEPPITVASVVSFISGFFGKHFKEIQSQISQAEAEADPIKRKERLHQLFKPMVEELLAIGMPNQEKDLPLIPGARGYVWGHLKDQILPDAFYNLYHKFMDPRDRSKLEELRLMNGGDLLACLCDGIGEKIPELGPQLLVEHSVGIADLISDQFPKAEDLPTALRSELKEQIKGKEKIVNENKLDSEWKGTCVDLNSWLENQITLLGESQDPAMNDLWVFIGEGIKPIFAHLFLNLAKGSDGDDVFHLVVSKLMTALNRFIEENSDEIFTVYQNLKEKEAKRLKDEEANFKTKGFVKGKPINPLDDEEFIRLFQPLAQTIIKEAGLDNPDDRPTPGVLGKKFWIDFEEKYLPQLLIKMYVNTSSWQHKVEEYREQIKEITDTNYIPESCQVLARWVGDIIPSYLASGNGVLAQSIYDLVKTFLKTNNTSNQSVDDFLKDHEAEIKFHLGQNIFDIATIDLYDRGPAKASATNFLDAAFAKFFNNLTTHLHSKEDPKGENYEEDFLVKTTLGILDVINKHFSKMNEVKRQKGKGSAHQIDAESMFTGYGDALHSAISMDFSKERKTIRNAQKIIDTERRKISKTTRRDRIEASRRKIKEAQTELDQTKSKIDEYRLNTYFKPFVEDILKILDLEKPDDLPMSESIWKTFCSKVIPQLTMEIFDEVAKPYRRNQMLLVAMEAIEENLDAETPSIQDSNSPSVVYEDSTQKDLDLACGELVLQLFQMVPIHVLPEAISRSMFRIAKIKDTSGEKIGRMLRTKLKQDWSAIKILDQGVAVGMTNIYEGQWDKDPQNEKFIPTKGGKPIEGPGEWQSDLPMSVEEREVQAQQRWEKEQALATQLKRKMVKVPHKAINLSIKDFFVAPWKRLHKSLNRLILNHLGSVPLIVKQFCDYICHKIFFTFIGGLLSIISYPARKIVSLITDLYLSVKAKHVFNTMQMDIHENLYYKLCDALKEALKIHKQDPSKDLITRLVASAVLRT